MLLPTTTAEGEILDVLDGLVLAGGGDLDPLLYGESRNRAADIDKERDHAEIGIARRAQLDGIPTLGVCRGAQVLAVAFGGTLVPHLGEDNPHVLPNSGHTIGLRRDSRIAGMLGDRVWVNSLHHQAIRNPGPCWKATAWADDGVIEAIEWNDETPWQAVGVQWHPELMVESSTSRALFGWLIDRSMSHTDKRQRIQAV